MVVDEVCPLEPKLAEAATDENSTFITFVELVILIIVERKESAAGTTFVAFNIM